jgi:ABC-type phosphate transport system substrate-binding protein
MDNRRLRLALLLIPLALAASSPLASAGNFVVIVNGANPVASLPSAEVSRIFLRKVLAWPGGRAVSPVDLVEESPVRDAFSRALHGRSAAATKAYWQKMIFSGRDVPPPEKSPAEVLSFVRSEVGAIGYIPPGIPLGDDIHVLRVTP